MVGGDDRGVRAHFPDTYMYPSAGYDSRSTSRRVLSCASFRDADQTWQVSKARLEPVEAYTDLIEAAYPEETIEGVAAADKARIAEQRDNDKKAASVKKTAAFQKKVLGAEAAVMVAGLSPAYVRRDEPDHPSGNIGSAVDHWCCG